MLPVRKRYRIIALVLDLLFVFLSMILIGFCYGLINSLSIEIFNQPIITTEEDLPLFSQPQNVFFSFILFMLLSTEALTGVTPGKLVMSIHPATHKGTKGSSWFYLGRFLLRYLPLILIVVFEYFQLFDYLRILLIIWALINMVVFFIYGMLLHELAVSSVTLFKEEIQP